MILYILSKVSSSLPEQVISDYITEHGYTNYFNIQSTLGELLQSEMIQEDRTFHRTYYMLTDTGREALEYFGGQLPGKIRWEITHYLKEKQFEIINGSALISDYKQTAEGEFLATCTIREGTESLFTLSLSVPTEEDARKICGNWQEQSSELYQQALVHLLKE